MAEINDLLSNISNIKTDIKSAIENKGQNVTNFASYPNAIQNIVSGGPSGIKIFDSIANMQNSSNSSIGDLAIVYNSTIDNITENTQFAEATFPETVTLSTAVTDYIELQFKAVDESLMFDCWGNVDSQRFYINCYSDDGSGNWNDYRIEYTSSDGLTYTRTRFQKNQEDISGNIMDFGMLIVFGSRWGEPTWDDRIGDFIKAGTVSFEGMYKHNGTNYNWANTGLNTISKDVYKGKFYGNNIITYGTGNIINGLNIDQLKDRVNLYSNLSEVSLEDSTNAYNLFYSMSNIKEFPHIKNSEKIINASCMFYHTNITEIDNTYNFHNVEDSYAMFRDCYNLISVNSSFMNLKNSSSMFHDCYNLVNIPNINYSNIISSGSMFAWCYNLSDLRVNELDLGNVTDMGWMFYACYNLVNIPHIILNKNKPINAATAFTATNISNLDFLKQDNNIIPFEQMQGCFGSCLNLININNIEFGTGNILYTNNAFEVCRNLINVNNIIFNGYSIGSIWNSSISQYENINMINITNLFCNCNSLQNIDNVSFKASIINNNYYLYAQNTFMDCHNLQYINNVNLNKLYSGYQLFNNCSNLRDIDLYNWSNVVSLYYAFNNCINLSDSAYANIANMLPNANQLGNMFIAHTGLNIKRFTSSQNIILKQKGYLEFQQNYYTVVYS